MDGSSHIHSLRSRSHSHSLGHRSLRSHSPGHCSNSWSQRWWFGLLFKARSWGWISASVLVDFYTLFRMCDKAHATCFCFASFYVLPLVDTILISLVTLLLIKVFEAHCWLVMVPLKHTASFLWEEIAVSSKSGHIRLIKVLHSLVYYITHLIVLCFKIIALSLAFLEWLFFTYH